MPRYMETAAQLHDQVRSYLVEHFGFDQDLSPDELQKKYAAAAQLGHIVNLAVRCSPRSVQGTVRKNIVAKALEGFCDVSMHKHTDSKTGWSYNKISIKPRYAPPRTPATQKQDTPKQKMMDFDAQNGAKTEPVGFEEHPDHIKPV